MLRLFLAVIGVPVAALLMYLGLSRSAPRADFIVAGDEPRTLDPARVSLLDEIMLTRAMFEGLTRLNADTFLPEPGIASDWEANADASEYVFHLRPETRWSNGAPLTADHFRYAWLRVLDPQTKAQYSNLLFVIDGAEEYFLSRGDPAAVPRPAESVGIDVLAERTLRVRLKQPCSYFLDLASFITYAPVYPPAIERWRESVRRGESVHWRESEPTTQVVGRDPAAPTGVVAATESHADANGRRHGTPLGTTAVRGQEPSTEPRTPVRGQDRSFLWTRPGNIVCNGPFILSEWEFKRRIRLRRNPQYWQDAQTRLNTIEMSIVSDPNAALLGYETDEIDFVRSLPSAVARVLAAQQKAGRRPDFHIGGRFSTYFFRVNCSRPPLDNADLRKALSLALDREPICASVMGLGEQPAYTYVPTTALDQMPRLGPDGATIFYQPPRGLGADLTPEQRHTLAREYLKRSGFDRIAASRPIELMYAANPDYQRVAEAIQVMWEQGLGIRVVHARLEPKVLSERVRKLDYDLVRSDWFGDYFDPSTYLDMYTTHNGQNRTGWSNAEYDRLIAAAARETDNARRYAIFHDAEKLLCEDELPIIPVYFRTGNFLLKPQFAGLRDNVLESYPIERAGPQ